MSISSLLSVAFSQVVLFWMHMTNPCLVNNDFHQFPYIHKFFKQAVSLQLCRFFLRYWHFSQYLFFRVVIRGMWYRSLLLITTLFGIQARVSCNSHYVCRSAILSWLAVWELHMCLRRSTMIVIMMSASMCFRELYAFPRRSIIKVIMTRKLSAVYLLRLISYHSLWAGVPKYKDYGSYVIIISSSIGKINISDFVFLKCKSDIVTCNISLILSKRSKSKYHTFYLQCQNTIASQWLLLDAMVGTQQTVQTVKYPPIAPTHSN